MYKKLLEHLAVLILAFGLVSCAPQPIAPGQVGLLHPGSTWYGITQAVKGGIGTEVWNQGNLWLLAWPQNGREAFAGIDVRSCCHSDIIRILTPKANIINIDTWNNEMRPWLTANGWYRLPLSAIPAGLVKVFSGSFTFILIPEEFIQPDFLNPQTIN